MKIFSEYSPENINHFFTMLYGPEPPGYLAIGTKNPNETRWVSGKTLNECGQLVHKLAQTRDVYFGLGLQPNDLGKKLRGTADQVIAIPGVWIDIDIADATHKNPNLPRSIDEAESFVYDFPLPPSLIVHSGHGLHAYWLFRNLWIFQNADERERAASLVKRFQAWFISLANLRGWKIDNTSDLARLLRVPGTTNYKREPVPVFTLDCESNPSRYHPDEIEIYFEVPVPELDLPKWAGTAGILAKEQEVWPPANSAPIVEGCAWIRHCREEAQTLPGREWYAMLSIIGRCENGPALAHEWSAPYPDYSEEEAEDTLHQALSQGGPRTCQNIQNLTGGTYCKGCSFAGEITSPIVLGHSASASMIDGTLKHYSVEELNKTHAVIMHGGICRILNEEQDLYSGYKLVTFSTKPDFDLRDGKKPKGDKTINYWLFPSLKECRESFNRLLNYSFPWPEEEPSIQEAHDDEKRLF